MTFLNRFKKISIDAPQGVLVITSLPVFGAVGTVTAAGVAVGSVLGALGALIDEINDASN